MTREIATTTQTAKPPTAQTRQQADLLGVYRSRIARIGARWSITDPPQGRDLELLRERHGYLASFQPASPKAIGARLARLFMRFPILANGSPDQVATYTHDLREFPLWAIEAGFASIIDGSGVKGDVKAPTSLEVQAVVRRVMRGVDAERDLLSAILNAQVERKPDKTPEEMEAVRLKSREVIAGIRKKFGFTPPRTQEDARDVRAKAQAALGAMDYASRPLEVSDQLKERLG